MQRPIDFSKLSLEELTPIVSMRPGKKYTREELKEARAAFMAALGADKPIVEEKSVDTVETRPVDVEEINLPHKSEPETSKEETVSPSDTPQHDPCHFTNAPTNASAKPEVCSENASIPETKCSAPSPESDMQDAPNDDSSGEIFMQEETTTAQSMEEEEFILKAESRLARFLYILYAYMLLPILAAESLVFLLASVGTAIMVRDVPFASLHIFAAVLYTMVVSFAWHQFMHRTKLGLLLNRSLIGVCIFRGLSMILSGTSLLTGSIYVALSVLYLVFFVAYDSTFVIPTQD